MKWQHSCIFISSRNPDDSPNLSMTKLASNEPLWSPPTSEAMGNENQTHSHSGINQRESHEATVGFSGSNPAIAQS